METKVGNLKRTKTWVLAMSLSNSTLNILQCNILSAQGRKKTQQSYKALRVIELTFTNAMVAVGRSEDSSPKNKK